MRRWVAVPVLVSKYRARRCTLLPTDPQRARAVSSVAVTPLQLLARWPAHLSVRLSCASARLIVDVHDGVRTRGGVCASRAAPIGDLRAAT